MLPVRPGGGRIPPGPNGPWFAWLHVKLANVFPLLAGSEHPVELSVLSGVSPELVEAVKGVVARLITSLSGLSANET